MELKIGETIPDRDVLLLDPFFWHFYKTKESYVDKAQKELNKKLCDSVLSYGEMMDIIMQDWTDEQKALYEDTKDLGWAKDNLGLGKTELFKEQTITNDGTIIIRFQLCDTDDEEYDDE